MILFATRSSDAYGCGMAKSKPDVPKEVREAEAAKLQRLWDDRIKGQTSQDEFGVRYGIGNQSMVSQYLKGKTPLNVPAAIGFSRGLGVLIGEFSPRLADLVREAAPRTDHLLPPTLSPEAAAILDAFTNADDIGRARMHGFAMALSGKVADDAEVERRMPVTQTSKAGGRKRGPRTG